MRFLLALFSTLILFSSPAYALNLQISSGVISADGFTVTLTMNDSSLSGSTSGCFSFSGSMAPANISAASAVLSGGATITVTAAVPLTKDYTTSIDMAASPTCAISGATQGVSAGQTIALTNNSEYYKAGSSHWTGNVTYQGSPSNSTDGNGYPNAITWLSANGSIDFNLSSMGGSICVWSFDFSNAFTLYEDGVPGTRNKLSSGTTYSETCWTGLDTGAHTWSIVNSAASGLAIIEALRISTPVFTTVPTSRSTIVGCGASMMNIGGGGSAPDNTDTTQPGLTEASSGVVWQGTSYSGQNLYTTLRDSCPSHMVTLGGAIPFLGFMEPDSNDLAGGTSLANEQAATQTVITNIMANATPPQTLIVLEPYATAANLNGTVCSGLTVYQCTALYSNAIEAGVTAVANPLIKYVHTNQLASGAPDWYDYTSVHNPCDNSHDTNDNVHACGATSLSGVGFGKISNRETPIIEGYLNGKSFSISGGASGGAVGSPSSAFTVTLGGTGSLFVDPITVHSSIGSDTICIVGGSCASGSVTLPVSYGSHTFQFTVQPATIGSRTISYTNLPDAWVSPTSNTYNGLSSLGSSQTGGVRITGGARIQ